jgi:hypothetical protein
MAKLKKGSAEAKAFMAKIRSMKGKGNGGMKGKGLLGDIASKAKDLFIDKASSYVKDNKLISKGLAAASLNPTFTPVTAPLAAAASLFGYGKKKRKNMKMMML